MLYYTALFSYGFVFPSVMVLLQFLLHQALLYANWLGDEVCRSRPLTSLALALLRDAAHCRQLCWHTPPERLSAACLYLAVKCLKLDVADGPLAGFEWWKVG